jgi:hypothetical protein
MAAMSGTAGSVLYMTGGTTVVVGIAEWSIDIGMSPAEITAFGDSWQAILPSVREFSGSFSGNSDSDTSQATLRNAMLGGSVVALRLHDTVSTYWNVATCYLTGQNNTISVKGKGDRGWDFQGSGALTYV